MLRNKLWTYSSAVIAAESFSLFDYGMFVNVFWEPFFFFLYEKMF